MEDFNLFKGTGIGFEDLWDGNDVISEVGLEKSLNKEGLRYRLNKTKEEADAVGNMYDLPGMTVNLPIIGETYIGPPKVESIWEALGFTATSNNEARQREKLRRSIRRVKRRKESRVVQELRSERLGSRSMDIHVSLVRVVSFMRISYLPTRSQWVDSTWEKVVIFGPFLQW